MTNQFTIPIKLSKELDATATLDDIINSVVRDPTALRELLLTLSRKICSVNAVGLIVEDVANEALKDLYGIDAYRIEELGKFLLSKALLAQALHKSQE